MSQHRTPCKECPWRRVSLRGWLGPHDAKQWVLIAHGEAVIDCHLLHQNKTHQCAGAAIYRANVLKECRSARPLSLPQDKATVFSDPGQFLAHHTLPEDQPQEE